MTTDTEALPPLLPCPFCGEAAQLTTRPDNRDGTAFFAAVACYCGGYSACAHKMAVRPTQRQATEEAAQHWNTRAALAQRQQVPEHCPACGYELTGASHPHQSPTKEK